ncbi:MAG: hypothetical protein MUF49_10685 [Oculatellaceae cyanobacterium Prado106]|nr:hypothetical protein [Oculatellaceae cyanobacterium Prado106]
MQFNANATHRLKVLLSKIHHKSTLLEQESRRLYSAVPRRTQFLLEQRFNTEGRSQQ